jgi:hypothetical protein
MTSVPCSQSNTPSTPKFWLNLAKSHSASGQSQCKISHMTIELLIWILFFIILKYCKSSNKKEPTNFQKFFQIKCHKTDSTVKEILVKEIWQYLSRELYIPQSQSNCTSKYKNKCNFPDIPTRGLHVFPASFNSYTPVLCVIRLQYVASVGSG